MGLLEYVREINEVIHVISDITRVKGVGVFTFDCGDYSVRLFVKGLDDALVEKLFGDVICRVTYPFSLEWKGGKKSKVGSYDIHLSYGVEKTVVRVVASLVAHVDMMIQYDGVSVWYYPQLVGSEVVHTPAVILKLELGEDVSREEFVQKIVDALPKYADYVFVNHDEFLSFVYDVVGGLHDFLVGDFFEKFVVLRLFP